MLSGFSASLSALTVSQVRLNLAAHHLANAKTEGFKKATVILEESSAGGVKVSLGQGNESRFDEGRRSVVSESFAASSVDLGKELVELLATKRFSETNFRALEAQKRVLGALHTIRE
ncbi:MAG: hypothetical protein D6690_15465 [Nitrospirae bacterium]|nr:MAG: hypothetical protein D6690_15465 [Nitrospirota bacterium]